MIKTDTIVKLNGRTMYFPKVIFSKDELMRLYVYGHARPDFLKQVAVNLLDVDDIIAKYKKNRPTAQQGFTYLIESCAYDKAEIMSDLESFASGQLDLIDLSVKYGFYYYDLQKAFGVLLPDVDVKSYWKQHKKAVQKNTCVTLYGVDSTSKVKSIREKQVETVRERYGADNVMKTQVGKERLRQTMMSRYGVSTNLLLGDDMYQFSNKLYKQLLADNNWKRVIQYLSDKQNISTTEFIKKYPIYRRNFVISTKISDIIDELFGTWVELFNTKVTYPDNLFFSLPITFNSTFLHHYQQLDVLDVPNYIDLFKSKYEAMVANLLDELNVDYVLNDRTVLDGYEIDFYVQDKKIGIEINPSSSHNSNQYALKRSIHRVSKEKLYHYTKYKKAEEKGIMLIQLYEYDLEPSQFNSKIKYFLKQKLCGYSTRFYARNVVVEQVTGSKKKDCIAFLNKYHLQGAAKANTYYGMYHHDDLVGVASFTKHNDYVELKRLCFKYGYQIIGGLSKCIKHYFSDHADCQEIRSFSDNNIGNGNGYKAAGGEFIKEVKTSLRFVSPTNGLDNYSWQIATSWGAKMGVLSKYTDTLKTQEDINRYIEEELPHRYDNHKGYDRLYVVGSKLWRFSRK